MPQQLVWENEYKNPQLVTKEDAPQNDILRFFKFLKKEKNVILENLAILDLGCGTGRNANYLAKLGNQVCGLEISMTALNLAKLRANNLHIKVDYRLHNIGSQFPYESDKFDLALDVTSSNSLNFNERTIYLSETNRVLKTNGYFFVKTLCKDGDKNAKALLKMNPGPEPDTYIIKEMKLIEKVFSKNDFIDLYSKYFKILYLQKKTSYTRFRGRSYKRNFWLAYMQKT